MERSKDACEAFPSGPAISPPLRWDFEGSPRGTVAYPWVNFLTHSRPVRTYTGGMPTVVSSRFEDLVASVCRPDRPGPEPRAGRGGRADRAVETAIERHDPDVVLLNFGSLRTPAHVSELHRPIPRRASSCSPTGRRPPSATRCSRSAPPPACPRRRRVATSSTRSTSPRAACTCCRARPPPAGSRASRIRGVGAAHAARGRGAELLQEGATNVADRAAASRSESRPCARTRATSTASSASRSRRELISLARQEPVVVDEQRRPVSELTGGRPPQQAADVQQLGHLHRVGGRALAQVVAHDPEVEAALVRRVAADPADQHVVAARGVERGGVERVRRVVDHRHAGRATPAGRGTAAGRAGRASARSPRPSGRCRPAPARRSRTRAPRRARGSCASRHALALLGRVVVAVLERLDLRQHVEGDLVRVDRRRRQLLGLDHGLGLARAARRSPSGRCRRPPGRSTSPRARCPPRAGSGRAPPPSAWSCSSGWRRCRCGPRAHRG